MGPLWDESARTPHGYREASPEQVLAAEDVRRVDVRQPEEFSGELGHLPGAELVPLAQIAKAAEHWNRDETLVMICRSGNRSGQASAQLVQRGFRQVINMMGGMLACAQRGLLEGEDDREVS